MKFIDLTALLIRLSVGFVLFSAGFSKLAPDQIGNLIGPVFMPLENKSNLLTFIWYSVALIEIIAGTLLISQKFSMLGLLSSYLTFVGILTFTIIAGFGLTILINVFLLLLLSIEIVYNWNYFKKLSFSDNSTLMKSRAADLFPGITLPIIGIALIVLAIPLSITNSIFINIIVSFSILVFVLNILISTKTGFIDKLFIYLFVFISLIVVNGLYLLNYVPNIIYWIFGFIGLGLSIYAIVTIVTFVVYLSRRLKT